MRIGVLDDEAQDLLGRLHRDLQAHRRSPIMQINETRPDLEAVQQFGNRLTDGRKRDHRQHIGLAMAGQIGRDDIRGLRQRGHDIPEHSC
jgi:hypothetical protein